MIFASNISSPVTPARSEARTAGTGEEKLYVLVTRKVSPFKRKIAQKIGSKVSLTSETFAHNLSSFQNRASGVKNA